MRLHETIKISYNDIREGDILVTSSGLLFMVAVHAVSDEYMLVNLSTGYVSCASFNSVFELIEYLDSAILRIIKKENAYIKEEEK